MKPRRRHRPLQPLRRPYPRLHVSPSSAPTRIMIDAKTEAGQQALKDRSLLTPRQRSAFILFDGKRSVSQVLEATAGLGVTPAELVELVALGFLTPGPQSVETAATAAVQAAAMVARKADGDAANERYKQAYPLAAQLTGAAGAQGAQGFQVEPGRRGCGRCGGPARAASQNQGNRRGRPMQRAGTGPQGLRALGCSSV